MGECGQSLEKSWSAARAQEKCVGGFVSSYVSAGGYCSSYDAFALSNPPGSFRFNSSSLCTASPLLLCPLFDSWVARGGAMIRGWLIIILYHDVNMIHHVGIVGCIETVDCRELAFLLQEGALVQLGVISGIQRS
eukprot:TRINITY_DN7081_c0_g3_i1.p1 TRINITY_DN7081_c0_g3~~TRINITY_DN7081_c0_g3_i1.p1  ORF type:complete len:135 (+),score=6.34 TRINITY_DN7081_c0_g3_i1:81-485(+)